VVASKLIDYFDRRKLDNVGHQMLTTGEVVPIGFGESPQDYTETRENFGSCGGATLYSMDMIRTIGFFDPYFSTGYEDAEFGVRAVVAGYRSVLAPKACVYHKISRSVQKVRNDGYELMIRDAIWYTYFKLMPKELTRRAWPRLTAKFGMGLMANLVLLRFKEIRYALESLTRARSSHLVNRARNLTSPVINRSLRWQEIYARQTKFVMHDAYRFWKILIG
ncbi:MAG: hypothetical protein KTR24_09130, partial [Saprospiraceae bacterium]|nr:hypothetical protein [Saprospiraceae bacterium]